MNDPIVEFRPSETPIFSFLAATCSALLALAFWNAPELDKRLDMVEEPWQDIGRSGLDIVSPPSARAWTAAVQTAMRQMPVEATAPEAPPFAPPTASAPLNSPSLPSKLAKTSLDSEPDSSSAPSAAEPAAPAATAAPADTTAVTASATPLAGAGTQAAAEGHDKLFSAASDSGRLAFFGDSLANGYAAAAARWASTHPGWKVKDYGRVSTGLLAKKYYDWPREFAKICDQAKPDVVAFSFGANDVMDIKTDEGWAKFGSKPWIDAYGRRSKEMVDLAHRCGAKVVWFTLPGMRDRLFEEKAGSLREAQAVACSSADYCSEPPKPLAKCCSEFEAYGTVNGKKTLLRASDGIHMSFEGYYMMVRQALADLAPDKAARSSKPNAEGDAT